MNSNSTQDLSSTYKIDVPVQAPSSNADKAAILGEAGGIAYQQGKAKKPNGADSGLFSEVTQKSQYSIFNDYNVISFSKGNYPLTDVDSKNKEIYKYSTALDLISNPRGASIFMPRDFLLCARYGLPINRMITLRRFPYPVPDNIFDIAPGEGDTKNAAGEPDIARMVTYMDQDINKISDILKFTYKMNWAMKSAQTENVGGQLNGDQRGVSGFMGSLASLCDDGTLSRQAIQGQNVLAMNPLNDSNKIHGPVDSLARVWLRDIGLETDLKFQIVFDYELRSINGLNQKAMFIDLLSNILACTFNDARFWGGARIWVGGRPSPWIRKLAWMNSGDAEKLINSAGIAIKEAVKQFSTPQSALDTLKNIAMNGLNLALGKLLDKIGRPSTMVMNSLLKGDPIGDWHLTIGNPMNPIMCIGNLRMTDTEIEFGDRLGYDDFPTSIKVTCTLEQGLDRGRAEIESMFNQGYSRTYWTPQSVMRGKIGLQEGMGTSKNSGTINTFGSFTEDAIIRAAEQQTAFQKTEDGAFNMGVTQSQVVTTTTRQATTTNNNAMDSNQDIANQASQVDTDDDPIHIISSI